MCLFSDLPKPQDMGENVEANYWEKVITAFIMIRKGFSHNQSALF